jgi:hypothetical protein
MWRPLLLLLRGIKCDNTVLVYAMQCGMNIGHESERTVAQKGDIYFLTTGYDKQYARCTRAAYL